ncbi:N-acetylglucosamine-1-phosphodiester alpha-N-acetylglucosaminidase-like isoform X2 [Periophthalmus magnuspinnatus]|nr:N-acetylglucosamine-1-phosphodiester alpha-N-acetylglucosaminidase-like isoform X2 [Periophthalmus magnuspinnatus]
MDTRGLGLVMLCTCMRGADVTSFSSWPSSSDPSPTSAHTFILEPSEGRYVYGRMAVVQDALRTLSVLEPGGEDGCKLQQLVPAAQTALSGGCEVAVNAGFYNASTGQCLGNVVSDGRVVRSTGVLNAQFGIRSDGSLVFGYLSEEEVLDQRNPFVQLVSGVVWLLRDGHVYINQSLQVESDENQSIKVFRDFADMLSARTAVGHHANGSVVIFQSDGETLHRGMSLWEVADFLKQNGVINAINLDGGGSSSYILNGTLASYPPDPCVADSRWRCGRPVSTVLCVRSRRSNHTQYLSR